MPGTLGRWLLALGGILACMLVALLAFFHLDYTTARAMPTLPIVTLTETDPESPVAAGQSVVVFGQASDPDGIAAVQLWVNGQMVASQSNADPGSDQPFDWANGPACA
ncbi:MAG: Ig-like domain-containing protein [Chloroflexota bacterium]